MADRTAAPSSYFQYDLAEMFAGLHQAVSGCRIGQRQDLVKRWLDAPSLDGRAKSRSECRDDPSFLLYRSGAQGRAHDRQMTPQDSCEIELGLDATHQSDQHQSSAMSECLEVCAEIGC